jgi:hypothetical protein
MKISKKEKARRAPFDKPRSEELSMADDSYISRFGTDRELRELRAKIEARRFVAVPKKGMKTSEEIRARLADCEAQAEAENRAGHAPEDRALNLERLWSWAGALKWVLSEEVER